MNEAQYARLAIGMPKRIGLENLEDKSARTLIYGYTCSRDTWHLYLNEEGKFVRVLYDHDGFLIEGDTSDDIAPRDCLPNKRIYAQKSDFEFCALLMHSGEELPFTTFEATEPAQFYGKRLEELVEVNFENFEVTVDLGYEDLDLTRAQTPAFLGDNIRDRAVEAAVKVIEGQTEGYLRSHYLGAPRDGWLLNIPSGIETAVANVLKHYVLDTPVPYTLSEDTKQALMARVRDAIAEKLASVQAS